MYSWIYRRLPGGAASKVAVCLLLLTAVSAVLLFVVFPWVDDISLLGDVTVRD